MLYPMKLGVLQIQPFGNVAAGDEMDLIDPGSKLFHTAEPIFQLFPVTEPFCLVSYQNLSGVFRFLREPLRIATIHPGDDKNDFIHTAYPSFIFPSFFLWKYSYTASGIRILAVSTTAFFTA